jgi:2-polyprenyl-3-methyl-5-hydroxy-6-metoxy-1,4-benzoquinol methylase
MNRLAKRVINKFYKYYVMFHFSYYRFFNRNLKKKISDIMRLTEKDVGVGSAEESEQALPGFSPYRRSGYYRYMFGRYLYSLKYIRNKAVLDCACGFGWGSFLISGFTRELLSIDLDSSAIEFSNSTWKDEKLSFIRHSATELESLNRKFDVVLCFELIEHLHFNDGDRLLQQAGSVLTENGLIILTSGFPDDPEAARLGEQKNKFHLHLYTKEEIRNLLAKNGFSKLRFLGSFMIIAAKAKSLEA